MPSVRHRLKSQYDAVHNKKDLAAFIRHYASIFAIYGVFTSYMSMFYSTKGIPMSQIGLLMAIGPLASLVIQPFLGALTDKASNKILILRILTAGAVIAVFFYFIPKGFAGFAVASFLFMAFHTSILPLSDAYTVNYLTVNGQKFSMVRMCGSFAFSVTAMLSGYFLNNANLWLIFPFTAALYTLAFLNAGTLPKMPMSRSKEHTPFREVLKDRKLLLILVFAFFLQLSMFFNASFLGVYLKDLDFPDKTRGLAFSLVAFSEIPVLLVIERVMRRHRLFSILIFAGFLMVGRSFVYALLPTPGFIILSQSLSGLTYMSVTYCAITYINDKMPMEYKATGQSLLALVQNGAGNILGSVLGGLLSSRYGIANTYIIFGCALMVTTCIFLLMEIIDRRKTRRDTLFTKSET